MEGERGVKAGVKGEKGAKGCGWCKSNSKLGFWVPTTCDHKNSDYNM